MTYRTWPILILAFTVVSPAYAEVFQLEQIHELAETVFGLPAESNPANPCPCVNQAPCPCSNFCPSALPACTCSYLSTSSPNLKLLGRVWYYGRAMKNNASPAIKSCARQWLVDWHLTAQQTWGHTSINDNSDEVLTASHGQLYLAGVSAAYLFGLNGGQPIGGTGGPYPNQDVAVVNGADPHQRVESPCHRRGPPIGRQRKSSGTPSFHPEVSRPICPSYLPEPGREQRARKLVPGRDRCRLKSLAKSILSGGTYSGPPSPVCQ